MIWNIAIYIKHKRILKHRKSHHIYYKCGLQNIEIYKK